MSRAAVDAPSGEGLRISIPHHWKTPAFVGAPHLVITTSLFANNQEKSDLHKILSSLRLSGGDNARRHTHGGAVSGNIGEDQSHRAYFCSRSNVNATYHLRVRAKLDAIADDGGVVRAVAITDCHALPQRAVCS